MTKLGKGLLIGFLLLLVVILAGITFTIGWRPFFGPKARPLTDRKFESTPQRLERGKYLDRIGLHVLPLAARLEGCGRAD